MSQMLVLLFSFGFTFFSSGFFIRRYDDVFDYIPSNKILCFRKAVGKKSIDFCKMRGFRMEFKLFNNNKKIEQIYKSCVIICFCFC